MAWSKIQKSRILQYGGGSIYSNRNGTVLSPASENATNQSHDLCVFGVAFWPELTSNV